MLALAALCLHYHTTSPIDHSSIFLQAAETHGPQTIEGVGRLLRDLPTSEIDSTLTCSRIICVLGFAFFRRHRRNGATIADSKAWTWLQLLRGVKAILSTITESGQAINEMISKDVKPDSLLANAAYDTTPGDIKETSSHPLFHTVRQSHQESFSNLRMALNKKTCSLGAEQGADLLLAVDRLQITTQHICSGKIHSLTHAICTWPCNISQGFVDMLTSGNTFALAVHAHWLMLVVLIEDLWWIDNMGRAGIREIIDFCSKAEAKDGDIVSVLLKWPRRMLDADAGGLAYT